MVLRLGTGKWPLRSVSASSLGRAKNAAGNAGGAFPGARWRYWTDVLLILLLGGVLYLPGLGRIPLFDRDEPRYAVAAREMLTRHNFAVPHFNGAIFPDKPPLAYWFMDISYALFGIHGRSARLPSALFSALTLLVVYAMTRRRFGRATGVLAAFMLSVCGLYFVEARLALTDPAMIFSSTVAMACVWSAWDAAKPPGLASPGAPAPALPRYPGGAEPSGLGAEPLRSPARRGHLALSPPARGAVGISRWTVLIFWLAMAAGTMAKGVTPLFVLSAMVTLSIASGSWNQTRRPWVDTPWMKRIIAWPGWLWKTARRGDWRWWRILRPQWGIPLFLALIAPWLLAAWRSSQGRLIELMFLQNVVRRTTSGLQHHAEPPGFYLLTIWGTFWPWSILLVPAAYHAVRRLRRGTGPPADPKPYLFLLAWIVPSWLLFELFVTKMVQYVLPLFVPMIILCADTLVQSWRGRSSVLAARWFAAARWVWMAVWLVLAGLLTAGAWWLFHTSATFFLIVPTAAAGAGVGLAGALCWSRRAWPYVTIGTFALTLLLANTVTLPNIQALQLSRRAAARMRQFAARGFHMAAAGYIEPSLVFYCGRKIQLFSHPQQLLQAVSFASGGTGPARVVARKDPPTQRKGPSVEPRRPAGSRGDGKFCVLVNRRVLHYLRKHRIRYFPRASFTGLQLAHLRPVRLTLITNVRRR